MSLSALNSTLLNFTAGEDNQLVASTIGAAAVLAATALYYALSSRDKEHEFPKLPGIQLYHAWNFFQRRHDFLQLSLKRTLGKSFSFNVLHHNVIALAGEDARRVFFSNQHLDFNEGYKILMGAAPQISNVDIATEESNEGDLTLINKRLNRFLNKSRIEGSMWLTCYIRSYDLKYRSRFPSRPPHITTGHYQQSRKVGERW